MKTEKSLKPQKLQLKQPRAIWDLWELNIHMNVKSNKLQQYGTVSLWQSEEAVHV